MTNDLFLKELGNRIRTIRRSKNMTLKQVTAKCGLDDSGLSRIELGKSAPNILSLKSIAEALRADIMDFL